MPGVQLSLEFTPCQLSRAGKRRPLVAATPWKDRAVTTAEPVPSPLWVLPAAALAGADVAALRREIRSGWRQAALCAGSQDPEAWFPDPGTSEEDTADARAACIRCPVRRSCLAQALLGDEDGLWGGLTRRQRRTVIDQHDPDPATGQRDWPALLDTLLLRLTTAPVPAAGVPLAGRSAA